MIHRADVLGRITADLKTQAPDHIAVSKCRIASIDPNHAMILPHDAEHARRMGWMCDRVVEAGGTGSPIHLPDRGDACRLRRSLHDLGRPYQRSLSSDAAICLIIPCSSAPTLSNNIIQKGLAFGRDWSGSVVNSGR